MTATMVYCEACGKRCAVGYRRDDGGIEMDVSPPGVPRTGWTIPSNSPISWQCRHCRALVGLDAAQARRAGRAGRLIAANVPATTEADPASG
jgi:hypothetical protein